MVRLDCLSAQVVAHLVLVRERAAVRRGWRARSIVGAERGQRDLRGGIKVEPLFRGNVRRVRAVETDREEEGTCFAFEALEQANRFGGPDAIGVLLVFALVREPAQRRAECAGLEREDPIVLLAI